MVGSGAPVLLGCHAESRPLALTDESMTDESNTDERDSTGTEQVQDAVALMSLDPKTEVEVDGKSEVCTHLLRLPVIT